MERARGLGMDASGSIPVLLVRKFLADRGPQLAVLIAWNALFSVFPIILAVAAVGGVFLSHAGITQLEIETGILSVLPAGAGGAEFERALTGAQRHSGLLGILALIGFFWSASALFGTLEYSLGEILHAGQRPFAMQKLMSLLMMLFFVLLAPLGAVSSTVVAVLAAMPFPSPLVSHGMLVTALQVVVGLIA